MKQNIDKDRDMESVKWFDFIAKTIKGKYDAKSKRGLKAKMIERNVVFDMLSDIDIGYGGKKNLDAGCGPGRYITQLLKLKGNANVVAVDASVNMLKVCHEEYTNERLALIVADIKRIPFQKKSFDIVLCLDTLQYLTEKPREVVLNDLIKLVKPRGIIIIDVKNSWCPYYWFKRTDTLANYYSISSIIHILKKVAIIEQIKGIYPLTAISPIVVIKAAIPVRQKIYGTTGR